MVTRKAAKLRVGHSVRVPWGLSREVEGTIVEVWGDPPQFVRVHLHFEEDDADAEPTIVLLEPSSVTAA